MPNFELQATAAENVRELRRALGSVTKPLSRDDLAALIAQEHPGRKPNGTTVQRWERGVEPDYYSARIMASMAGVSLEAFVFGDDPLRPQEPTDDMRGQHEKDAS